jgi:endonuclease/exonuclease/phosphatase (EEP) superfamily protein YafD
MTDPAPEAPLAPPPSGAPPAFRPRRAGPGLIAFATLSGLLLRLTIRDRWPGLAIVFYATPLPVLAAGVVFSFAWALYRRRRKAAACWAVLVGALLPWTIHHDWRRAAPVDSAQSDGDVLSVLFWNVARRRDLSSVTRYIHAEQPDLVAFVEATGDPLERRTLFQKELPEYDVTIMGNGMFVLAKGTSGETQFRELDAGSQTRQLRVTIRDRAYEVFVVDITASVWRPRGRALRVLSDMAEELSQARVILLGDFNTPPDSVHFAALRTGHRLLWESAGAGYAPTWPIPMPVLQLDQVWVNDRLAPVSCRHGLTFSSDHRPVLARIRAID